MQRAPDCDMTVVHDEDLVKIYEFGHDAVSESGYWQSYFLLMLAATRNPRTRRDDGSLPEVEYRDT